MRNEEPFFQCPEYNSEHFFIRKMKMEDGPDLFACYSDKEAAKYFNGDCCNDDFYYTDYEKFLNCMEFWESRYEIHDFVRFSVVEKETGTVIGMVEVCPSQKYSVDDQWMGILRIDLRSQYEAFYDEVLQVMIEHLYDDFGVSALLTKAQEEAKERRGVLRKYHFVSAMDECNISFRDYFLRF